MSFGEAVNYCHDRALKQGVDWPHYDVAARLGAVGGMTTYQLGLASFNAWFSHYAEPLLDRFVDSNIADGCPPPLYEWPPQRQAPGLIDSPE